MERKEVETKQEQEQAVSTERKGMTTRSRRPSVDDETATASKSQKVEEDDQATEPKTRMVKCSQKFIDWLILKETKPMRTINFDLFKGYTGSYDFRGPMLRCDAAVRKLYDSNAEILRQYRANGEAYCEVVDELCD